MNKPPVIGITVDSSDQNPARYELPSDYARAVERAGGLPLLLPYRVPLSLVPRYVDLLDGILFTGGSDLDPALYGQTYHPKAQPIDPDRQKFEMALLAEVERRRTPALGICLGSQLMNVYRGGSMIQFLPDSPRDNPIEHRSMNDPTRRHEVALESGTVLADAVGKPSLSVNTRHKQAVAQLGRGLRVNARATDGIIEGVEDPAMPLFLGVQWHAENLTDTPEQLAIFRLLVQRASAHGL